jgi:hypothetical protein
VRGPASVVAGRVVRFQASGFRPGSTINVILSPADKPSCCAFRIPSTFLVSHVGNAVLIFRMPRYYFRCVSAPPCPKVRWTRRETATVTVFGYLEQAVTTTSVVR